MDEVDFIRNSYSNDAGSAMAISYYYGYLKLMLPKNETPNSLSKYEFLQFGIF